MYEAVRKNRKPAGNGPFYIVMISCLLVIVFTVGMFGWSWYYRASYSQFLRDLSNSTYYAYNHDSMTVEREGQSYPIIKENIYTIYATITSRGSGRMGRPPKTEPEAVIYFGDGSYMELWMVDLNYADNGRTRGLFISYVNQKGHRYSYDSDRLELLMLPLKDWQNVPKE